MMDIKKLKENTDIGDKYRVYYHGTDRTNKIHTVTRFTEKSVWTSVDAEVESRESWNTLLGYINKHLCSYVW